MSDPSRPATTTVKSEMTTSSNITSGEEQPTNNGTEALTEDPRPDGLRSAPSLVIVNTGNGKGKSSAAFGVMLRGVAVGWKVAVCQFIKSSEWKVGEE